MDKTGTILQDMPAASHLVVNDVEDIHEERYPTCSCGRHVSTPTLRDRADSNLMQGEPSTQRIQPVYDHLEPKFESHFIGRPMSFKLDTTEDGDPDQRLKHSCKPLNNPHPSHSDKWNTNQESDTYRYTAKRAHLQPAQQNGTRCGSIRKHAQEDPDLAAKLVREGAIISGQLMTSRARLMFNDPGPRHPPLSSYRLMDDFEATAISTLQERAERQQRMTRQLLRMQGSVPDMAHSASESMGLHGAKIVKCCDIRKKDHGLQDMSLATGDREGWDREVEQLLMRRSPSPNSESGPTTRSDKFATRDCSPNMSEDSFDRAVRCINEKQDSGATGLKSLDHDFADTDEAVRYRENTSRIGHLL